MKSVNVRTKTRVVEVQANPFIVTGLEELLFYLHKCKGWYILSEAVTGQTITKSSSMDNIDQRAVERIERMDRPMTNSVNRLFGRSLVRAINRFLTDNNRPANELRAVELRGYRKRRIRI